MLVAVEFSEVHRLSNEEFQQMVESGVLEDLRVELIDGLLCDMSPPSPEHDAVIEYLNHLLARTLDTSAYRVRPLMGLTIGNSAPQPDLAIVRVGTLRPYYPATAEMVIEVSRSSLRRDLIVKPTIYASAGVTQYWVINVDHARVIVHREPTPGSYRSRQELGPDGVLDASFVGIGQIPVADVLGAASGR